MTLATLFLLFSCSWALAGPWEDFVQAHRDLDYAHSKWTLCVRPNTLAPGDLLNDPEYQQLVAGGDWALEMMSVAQAQDLQTSKGASWALLSPSGEVAAAGPGHPKGAALLEAVHGSGAQARFEILDAFLKENPRQGDARLEALAQELRLLRSRMANLDALGKVKVPVWHPEPGSPVQDERLALAGAEGEAQAAVLGQGVEGALRALAQVPAWTREGRWVASRLALFNLGQGAGLKRFFAGVASTVEEEAAKDPEDAGLVQLWLEVTDGADLPPEGLSGKLLPVPGSVWPSARILPLLVEPFRRRQDWEGELKLLAELTPQRLPEPLTQQGWDAYCELMAALLAQRTAALASRGSWDQARGTLDEALKWGGSRSVQVALMRRGTEASGDTAAWRGLFTQVAKGDLKHPAVPPLAPPLRLTLMGHPSWLLAWTALREAPELATWSPGELHWDIATPTAQAKAMARFSWNPGPRWVLTRGEDLLATGETCPAAKGLAAVLAAHGMPMLERMAQLLARNPDHLPTRRARFALLLKRMPDHRLEPLLAEDAARARLVLPFDPKEAWQPDEALWSGAAQAVLPAVETELRSWPADPELWQVWISWSRFHPGRPFILALARSLNYWFPNGDWRTTLPYPVHRAVAAELRRQGLFQSMRDWFQASWEVLDRRPLKDLRPWEKQYLLERRREEETAIFQPLRDALQALGMNDQQLEVEKTFGAMMGRATVRSR